jgi:hypothetical protein
LGLCMPMVCFCLPLISCFLIPVHGLLSVF